LLDDAVNGFSQDKAKPTQSSLFDNRGSGLYVTTVVAYISISDSAGVSKPQDFL
jgi:hypothetical protein